MDIQPCHAVTLSARLLCCHLQERYRNSRMISHNILHGKLLTLTHPVDDNHIHNRGDRCAHRQAMGRSLPVACRADPACSPPPCRTHRPECCPGTGSRSEDTPGTHSPSDDTTNKQTGSSNRARERNGSTTDTEQLKTWLINNQTCIH